MKVRKAVIPAAGWGSRMLPATKTVPKEMLPLVDRPAVQYIIEEAVSAGIEDILVITNRGKDSMSDYFDYFPELEERLKHDGKLKELEAVHRTADLANISFIRQKEARGLGHAIWRAKAFVAGEPFAVLLPDDVMRAPTPVIGQLIEAAEKYGASAIGVQQVSDEVVSKYGVIKARALEERVLSVEDMQEKPALAEKFSNYAILGRYVLDAKIFDILEHQEPGYGGEIQLTDALRALCRQEKMVAVDFIGKRYDTGNIRGFLEATVDFALDHPETGDWLRAFLKDKVRSL